MRESSNPCIGIAHHGSGVFSAWYVRSLLSPPGLSISRRQVCYGVGVSGVIFCIIRSIPIIGYNARTGTPRIFAERGREQFMLEGIIIAASTVLVSAAGYFMLFSAKSPSLPPTETTDDDTTASSSSFSAWFHGRTWSAWVVRKLYAAVSHVLVLACLSIMIVAVGEIFTIYYDKTGTRSLLLLVPRVVRKDPCVQGG